MLLQGDGYTSFKDIPVAQIKKITAQRLLESKQTIPHYYLTVDCKVDKLIALRKQLNEALASGQGGKLSVNDFVIKASALVCRCIITSEAKRKCALVAQGCYGNKITLPCVSKETLFSNTAIRA